MGQFTRSFRINLCKLALLLLSFISCESMASQVDALQAAMAYPTVSSTVPLISSVEVINAYHCPDCYDIRISGFDDTVAVQMDLRTEKNMQDHLEAKLLDVQRMSR